MFGTEYGLGYIILNFFILSLGVLAHFAKKKVKGQTLADFKTYFTSHFKDTLTTAIAAVVTFGALVATGGLGWIAAFTAGYACDSVFNKNAADNGK